MSSAYGAWDDEKPLVDPDSCCHNWLYTEYGNQFVCVRCQSRKPAVSNIHSTAVIGGKPQWRGHTDAKFPVEIDPTATVGPLTQIDAGCERPTRVGANTMIQGLVHIGHGVQIGAGCDIASGTVISGEATIGDHVRVGVNATISPYVRIAGGARIGAGAVVVKHVPGHTVVVGNPARPLRKLNAAELAWIEERRTECA